MEPILAEIEKALDAGLYYLAVMLAVAIPDICGALESKDGRSGPVQYKAWYDAHLANRIYDLTADDCYSLRCGVVHQGKFGLAGAQYDRAIFLLPQSKNKMVACQIGDAYVYSVEHFCKEVIVAVRTWFAAKQNDANVIANMPRLVRVHPNGLAPYIVGEPVIA
jgi:hypothetical protein